MCKPVEGDHERKYCAWLREEYPEPAIALKLVMFAAGGFPDRTILSQGVVFFIEFKRTKNDKPRPLQIKWHKILTRLGFKVYVCSSFREAKKATIAHLGGA